MRALVILAKVVALASMMLLIILNAPSMQVLNEGENSQIGKVSSNLINIKISKDIHDRLETYFSTYYPLEYGVCIYGKVNETEITILYEDPSMLEQTEESVHLLCPKRNKGLRYLGTIHSHPNSNENWCVLSDIDIAQDELISGVHCQNNHLVLYYRGDNYSRGYFAEIV